jgi:hypothetical protein
VLKLMRASGEQAVDAASKVMTVMRCTDGMGGSG